MSNGTQASDCTHLSSYFGRQDCPLGLLNVGLKLNTVFCKTHRRHKMALNRYKWVNALILQPKPANVNELRSRRGKNSMAWILWPLWKLVISIFRRGENVKHQWRVTAC